MGGVHELTGNYAKALEAYRAALDIAAPLQDVEDFVRSYWGMGKVYQAQAQWSQAISAFREAVKQVGQMRQSAAIDYLKASFVEQYMDIFDRLVQCELTIAQNEAAFTDAESSRARALSDLLAERKVDVRTGAQTELLRQLRELQATTASLSHQIRELKGQEDIEAIVKVLDIKLAESERQLDIVRLQLRGTHYATLQYPQPLTVAEAQKLLPPDTALLAYYVMEEETALWVVTAGKVKVHRLPVKVKQLEADIVTAFRVPMKRAAGSRGIFVPRPEEKAKARSLYQQLIAPVRVDLQGIKRLVIVPHRALFYLPFAALEMGEKGTAGDGGKRQGNGGKARYLIEDYAIVVVPSATVLRDIRNSKSEIRNSRFIGTLGTPEPKSEMNTVLAFAPFGEEKKQRVKTSHVPTRPSTKSGAGSGLPRVPTSRDTESPPLQNAHNSSLEFMRSYYRDAGLGFKPLYFSDDEVESVSRLFRPPGKVYAGDKATEARVKAECGRYRFLLFATHGILDDRNPQYSGVALAEARNPKSEIRNPKPEDGFLQTQEIFNLTLNADLVALSACETAFGKKKQSVKESNAEGFIGLTRGFLYAGTPTVVVSLWKVDDKSTAELMKEFYRQLVSGKCDKAEAMRRAQLKVRSKTSHPYFWAAFVVVGDWR
jgi:CHAT domain-containing protein